MTCAQASKEFRSRVATLSADELGEIVMHYLDAAEEGNWEGYTTEQVKAIYEFLYDLGLAIEAIQKMAAMMMERQAKQSMAMMN